MKGEILGPDMFIVFIVAVAGLLVPIWAFADAASRPSAAFAAARSSKAMWITLIAMVWLVAGIVRFVLACVYPASIRPRVKAISGQP